MTKRAARCYTHGEKSGLNLGADPGSWPGWISVRLRRERRAAGGCGNSVGRRNRFEPALQIRKSSLERLEPLLHGFHAPIECLLRASAPHLQRGSGGGLTVFRMNDGERARPDEGSRLRNVVR